DAALRLAVELADRYLSGPSLKDSALQILDRAGALLRLRSRSQPPELNELDAQLEQINQEKEAAVAKEDFEKAAHLRQHFETVKKRRETLLKERSVVDEELVREIVTRMEGGPF